MLKQLLMATTVLSLAVMPSFAQESGAPATPDIPPPSPSATEQPAAEATTDEMAVAVPVTPPPADAIVTAETETDMRADELIGTSVFNMQGEEVGSVEDIVFDKDGKIIGVVLSVGGGVLGLGAKSVGIAWQEVDVLPAQDALQISYTEEQLEVAPDFKTQEMLAAEAEAERAQQELQQPEGEPPPQ